MRRNRDFRWLGWHEVNGAGKLCALGDNSLVINEDGKALPDSLASILQK